MFLSIYSNTLSVSPSPDCGAYVIKNGNRGFFDPHPSDYIKVRKTQELALVLTFTGEEFPLRIKTENL